MQLDEATLDDILKGTSRAFYLSLAVLPQGARAPLSLAYLLARAADTVADSPADPSLDRQALLEGLRDSIVAYSPALWAERREALALVRPDNLKEQQLLLSVDDLLGLLERTPSDQQGAIRQVVSTLIDGMLWDQQLFTPTEAPTEVTSTDSARLPVPVRAATGLDDEEFERYTYLVAGCVGPFWSRVCAFAAPQLTHLASSERDDIAREFGKGLQWVNILRDVPRDQQAGRYYLPQLQRPDFRPRFLAQARRALSALSTACEYPTLFPSSYLRYRMAVLWLLVLAYRTLEKLFRHGGARELGERVKVPRWEVLTWVGLSPLLVISDSGLKFTLKRLQQRAEQALSTLEEPHAKNL